MAQAWALCRSIGICVCCGGKRLVRSWHQYMLAPHHHKYSVSPIHTKVQNLHSKPFTHYNKSSWEGICRPGEHIAVKSDLTSCSWYHHCKQAAHKQSCQQHLLMQETQAS